MQLIGFLFTFQSQKFNNYNIELEAIQNSREYLQVNCFVRSEYTGGQRDRNNAKCEQLEICKQPEGRGPVLLFVRFHSLVYYYHILPLLLRVEFASAKSESSY